MDDPRRSERLKGRAVETKEPVEAVQRTLGSGSKWDSQDLELLKVSFDPADAVECLPVLADDPEWDPPVRQGIRKSGFSDV